MTNLELMEIMADTSDKDHISIEGVIEAAKSKMCDKYCKYPETYHMDEDDINFARMVEEICSTCPLNIF